MSRRVQHLAQPEGAPSPLGHRPEHDHLAIPHSQEQAMEHKPTTVAPHSESNAAAHAGKAADSSPARAAADAATIGRAAPVTVVTAYGIWTRFHTPTGEGEAP